MSLSYLSVDFSIGGPHRSFSLQPLHPFWLQAKWMGQKKDSFSPCVHLWREAGVNSPLLPAFLLSLFFPLRSFCVQPHCWIILGPDFVTAWPRAHKTECQTENERPKKANKRWDKGKQKDSNLRKVGIKGWDKGKEWRKDAGNEKKERKKWQPQIKFPSCQCRTEFNSVYWQPPAWGKLHSEAVYGLNAHTPLNTRMHASACTHTHTCTSKQTLLLYTILSMTKKTLWPMWACREATYLLWSLSFLHICICLFVWTHALYVPFMCICLEVSLLGMHDYV